MITDSEGMRKVEKSSGLSTARLMEKAGAAVFDALTKEMPPNTQALVLCGKGNNGGDGFVLARLLAAAGYAVSVYACEGTPVSKEALAAYHKLPAGCLLKKQKIDAALDNADVIVDAVYGYGYHGALSKEDTQLFAKVNASGKDVFSIDVNSGCEADTGRYDRDAIRSRITYAMDCWKPFHLLRKDHGMAIQIWIALFSWALNIVPSKYIWIFTIIIIAVYIVAGLSIFQKQVDTHIARTGATEPKLWKILFTTPSIILCVCLFGVNVVLSLM